MINKISKKAIHFNLRCMRLPLSVIFSMILICYSSSVAIAQLGSGWVQYSPTKKIHLDDEAGLQTFTWTSYKSVCSPICADYRYESATETETFRILDSRSNRSEIRLQNEYSTGSRQFEGYVTIYAPLDDESLMQIFGSTSGATQMMIRGYAANGGSLTGAGATLATGIYGVELRVNVIHLQEDRGNKIQIYINGVKKAEIADNEAVTNYHKYGNYGTMRTDEAVVRWRRTRFFRDGSAPTGTAPAAPSNLTATAISTSQINLSWNDNSSNESTFRIERSTNGGSTWSTLTTTGSNTTSFSNTGLSASTTYHYRVRAENTSGNSAYTNIANATTHAVTIRNVALNRPVTFSSQPQPENPASAAVDGNTTSRWSASGYPQWIEVDLGSLMTISKTEVICYLDRAYRFTVDVKTSSTGAYTRVVDRSTNTTPGTVTAPITNTFTPVNARYVRITVTGASGYTGTWASLVEFRVFGTESTTSVAATQSPNAVMEEKIIPNRLTSYPNPFRQSNTINFSIDKDGKTFLAVYDKLGRRVAVLADEYLQAGTYTRRFNPKNLSSGVYIIQLTHAGKVTTSKLVKE